MAVTIRGKGVISGIAVGKIMLAGQNLDGYLVNYQPGSVDEEKNKQVVYQYVVATEAEIPPDADFELRKEEGEYIFTKK